MANFNELLADALARFNRAQVTRRIDLLQNMPAERLALYLAAELDDGVPTDWLDWLLEPEGGSNA